MWKTSDPSNLAKLGLNFNPRLVSSLSEEEELSSEGKDKGHRNGPRARLTREEGEARAKMMGRGFYGSLGAMTLTEMPEPWPLVPRQENLN